MGVVGISFLLIQCSLALFKLYKMKIILKNIVVVYFFLPFLAFSQQEQIIVLEIPKPPSEEVRQTIQKRSYVWIPAQWKLEEEKYTWVPGFWERKKVGYVFVSGNWIEKGRGYIWKNGYWKKINLNKWMMIYS